VSKNAAKDLLFARIQPTLAEHGFKFLKARTAFERAREDVIDTYRLDFYSSSKGHRIQPGIAMRYAALDRIYHQVSGAEPANQKYHAAINFALWRVFGGIERYEFLLTDDTVESVAVAILDAFRTVALPFFESHTRIADVDRLFNERPRDYEVLVHNSDDGTRIAFATIAARLVGNPRYEELVQAYREQLAVANGGHHLPVYDALLERLRVQGPSAAA
jgi:hypothetical protein